MPLVRRHGWAAKCRRCERLVDLDAGVTAWEQREEVMISLNMTPDDRLETVITEACGCGQMDKLPER